MSVLTDWKPAPGEIIYVYWAVGTPPKPGDRIELDCGTGIVDTAHASAGALEKRKLTVKID